MPEQDNRDPLVQIRVPRPLLKLIDEARAGTGKTRAGFLRDSACEKLQAIGHWPPKLDT